ncbi:MAG: ABC transporter permease subunit, partial [Acidaminobacteraceae bacterium]
ERQQGTLKLILSRPVFRDQLIMGKLLGASCIIGIVLIVTLIGNIVLFSLITGVIPLFADMIRLTIVLFFGFLYMMSFYIASLYMSMQSSNKNFSFLLMMVIWLSISFVIPQLADSQRSFVYNMSVTTQTITKISTDTQVSNIIEIFSPTVHFENLSFDLLQVNIDALDLSTIQILAKRSVEILYMLLPGFVLLIGAFIKFQREEANEA